MNRLDSIGRRLTRGLTSIADVQRHVIVDQQTGCWLWQRSKNSRGYGTSWLRGRSTLAHRASWILAGNPDPAGFALCHRCDTPACVNPSHLFLGTLVDNNRDRVAKGRSSGGRVGRRDLAARTHCNHGHPFDEANTAYYGKYRYCRACKGRARRAS